MNRVLNESKINTFGLVVFVKKKKKKKAHLACYGNWLQTTVLEHKHHQFKKSY